MAKYVITGGTGFLGYVTVKKLLEKQDIRVKLLVLPDDPMIQYAYEDVEIARGDICDAAFLRSQIEPGDTVIHMAGIVDIGTGGSERLYRVNVGGTKNIADVCLEKKVRKLVYTSSVHTILPLKGNKSMAEPEDFPVKKLVGDYAKSKATATSYLFEKAKEGLPVTVVYPAGIIGPCDYLISNTGQVVLDYISGSLKAYVKGGYNFVDVRDVAQGILSAAENGRNGEGYLLSGNCVTLKEMLTVLNEKIGRKKLPVCIPRWLVKMVAPFVEMFYKMRRKKPIFSSYSMYTLSCNCNFDHSKAERELGFTVRPAKETLCDEVDWFLDHGYGKSDGRKKITGSRVRRKARSRS